MGGWKDPWVGEEKHGEEGKRSLIDLGRYNTTAVPLSGGL